MQSGAVFDPSQTYRYRLWRNWQADLPQVTFVMLNPSTANAHTNDATLRRCLGFAQAWGFGSLEVVNLFAWVATSPIDLKQAAAPIGPDCDLHLLDAVRRADRVILGWGNLGSWGDRDRAVLELLAATTLHCLGKTQAGQPRHPLYLPRSVQPIRYC